MKLNLQAAIDGQIDEQLNLALCEWLGWLWVENYPVETKSFSGSIGWADCWKHPKLGCGSGEYELPNHITAPESLGLVHEVEKILTPDQFRNYIDNQLPILVRSCKPYWYKDGSPKPVTDKCATARQRVISILLTVKPEVFQP